MPVKILILSEPGDVHSHAVARALEHKGAEAVLWHMSDFPTRATESVSFEEAQVNVGILGRQMADLESPFFDTVWRRRPSYVIAKDRLHPADRAFSDFECNLFRRSLLNIIYRRAFWVNSQDAAVGASRKMEQHLAAKEVGFETPPTIYGNDPHAIRSFIRRHGGLIVYKPFRGIAWRSEETCWMPYTSLLSEADLVEDGLLQSTPGIYQALVPKSYEVRVTAMGRRPLSAKILSQQTERGRLDWRKAYDEIKMEPLKLPKSVARLCFKLMARLGIVFGCFDFIVKPDGGYVFLEVNEMGQFLFVETYSGIPLLDAFSEFLIQRKLGFSWDKRRVSVRYSDVYDLALADARKASEAHVVPPELVLEDALPLAETPKIPGEPPDK